MNLLNPNALLQKTRVFGETEIYNKKKPSFKCRKQNRILNLGRKIAMKANKLKSRHFWLTASFIFACCDVDWIKGTLLECKCEKQTKKRCKYLKFQTQMLTLKNMFEIFYSTQNNNIEMLFPIYFPKVQNVKKYPFHRIFNSRIKVERWKKICFRQYIREIYRVTFWPKFH